MLFESLLSKFQNNSRCFEKHCTTYFQCWLNGNFISRLWLNCSVAKFYAMWRHTNNVQWQKNWVSCLLKLLSNYNFKFENLAIFYDFQSTLTILDILGPRGVVKSPLSPQEALIYQNATYFYHFKPFWYESY